MKKNNYRPQIEWLEDRTLLDGHAVATVSGTVPADGSAKISFTVNEDTVSMPDGHDSVFIGIGVKPAEGSALNPAVPEIAVKRDRVRSIADTELFYSRDALLKDDNNGLASLLIPSEEDESGLAVLPIPYGEIDVFINGQKGTSGNFELKFFLPGDLDGDNKVTREELNTVKEIVEKKEIIREIIAFADFLNKREIINQHIAYTEATDPVLQRELEKDFVFVEAAPPGTDANNDGSLDQKDLDMLKPPEGSNVDSDEDFDQDDLDLMLKDARQRGADMNGDGDINGVDLSLLLDEAPAGSDVNCDGELNDADVKLLERNLGSEINIEKVHLDKPDLLSEKVDESLLPPNLNGELVTMEETATLHGSTNPNATVTLRSANGTQEVKADKNGNYSFCPEPLSVGENLFAVAARDELGQRMKLEFRVFRFKNATFTVKLNAPAVKTSADGAEVLISGATSETPKSVDLIVNGKRVGPVAVNTDGKFEHVVLVESGVNRISAIAHDKSGRVAISNEVSVPALTVKSNKDTVEEGKEAILNIDITSPLERDLTVHVERVVGNGNDPSVYIGRASNDASESDFSKSISNRRSVTIRAGETNIKVQVLVVNDSIVDGDKTARINVTADGHVGAGIQLKIKDNDKPVESQVPAPSLEIPGSAPFQGLESNGDDSAAGKKAQRTEENDAGGSPEIPKSELPDDSANNSQGADQRSSSTSNTPNPGNGDPLEKIKDGAVLLPSVANARTLHDKYDRYLQRAESDERTPWEYVAELRMARDAAKASLDAAVPAHRAAKLQQEADLEMREAEHWEEKQSIGTPAQIKAAIATAQKEAKKHRAAARKLQKQADQCAETALPIIEKANRYWRPIDYQILENAVKWVEDVLRERPIDEKRSTVTDRFFLDPLPATEENADTDRNDSSDGGGEPESDTDTGNDNASFEFQPDSHASFIYFDGGFEAIGAIDATDSEYCDGDTEDTHDEPISQEGTFYVIGNSHSAINDCDQYSELGTYNSNPLGNQFTDSCYSTGSGDFSEIVDLRRYGIDDAYKVTSPEVANVTGLEDVTIDWRESLLDDGSIDSECGGTDALDYTGDTCSHFGLDLAAIDYLYSEFSSEVVGYTLGEPTLQDSTDRGVGGRGDSTSKDGPNHEPNGDINPESGEKRKTEPSDGNDSESAGDPPPPDFDLQPKYGSRGYIMRKIGAHRKKLDVPGQFAPDSWSPDILPKHPVIRQLWDDIVRNDAWTEGLWYEFLMDYRKTHGEEPDIVDRYRFSLSGEDPDTYSLGKLLELAKEPSFLMWYEEYRAQKENTPKYVYAGSNADFNDFGLMFLKIAFLDIEKTHKELRSFELFFFRTVDFTETGRRSVWPKKPAENAGAKKRNPWQFPKKSRNTNTQGERI